MSRSKMTRNAMKRPDVVQAIRNPKLFGSMFKSLDSWQAWIVWLKAVFGLEMDASEIELYRRSTGRTDPPQRFQRELRHGRQTRRQVKDRFICWRLYRVLLRLQTVPF